MSFVKRIAVIVLSVIMLVIFALPAGAVNGQVTYSGDAGEFIFAPGTDFSVTDLFPEFKDVKPGDKLTQEITVRNEASRKVKVKIYMRALGAHEDSVEFLSKMNLKVT